MSLSDPETLPKKILAIRRLRILSILLGLCLLVWLSVEDTSDRFVLIFSAAICILAAAGVWLELIKRYGERGYWLPLAGFLAGALTTPTALLLMMFKTGIHGHQTPDFSGAQIQAVLLRTPIWLISGLLVGLGVALYRRANLSGMADD